MSTNKTAVKSVGFSVTGEFITEHARNLWGERNFSKALDILECLMGSTRDQHEAILFGKKKLIGVNEVSLEDDDWTPPEHYCDSIRRAMEEGEHYAELLDRREDAAWEYARENWYESRGSTDRRKEYFTRISAMVGKDKAEKIWGAVMDEKTKADRHAEEDEDEEIDPITDALRMVARTRASVGGGPLSGLAGIAAMAHNQMSNAMVIAGLDPAALAKPDAILNRGMDITPTLDKTMGSDNGWLLPNGEFYGCGAMEHVGLAFNLLPEGFEGDSEQAAEDRGWIKLARSVTGFHVIGKRKPTKKQLTRLWDHAQEHRRDYEEMIASLPQ